MEPMARPLRYEAAGAVYHVMARGDGGKDVFDDDKDRFAWMDLSRLGMSYHVMECEMTRECPGG